MVTPHRSAGLGEQSAFTAGFQVRGTVGALVKLGAVGLVGEVAEF